MTPLPPSVAQHQVLLAIDKASKPAENGVDLVEILKHLDGPFREHAVVWDALDRLQGDGLVAISDARPDRATRWKLTARGAALLIAGVARETFSAYQAARKRRFDFESSSANLKGIAEALHREEHPMHVAVCDRAEPASTAMLCVAEGDLDGWWSDLDVEAKAEAFARFNFGSGSSVVPDVVPIEEAN